MHLRLPALYEGERVFSTAPPSLGLQVTDPRQESDAPLWPERFDARALQGLKTAMGSYAAAGQLQQRPAPATGGIFKRSWWRFFDTPPEKGITLQSWDTAFKTGEQNAWSVGQTWLQAEDGFYLLDQFRKRLEYPELKRALIQEYEKWRPDMVLVEDKASGQSLVQELKRGTRLPLIPLKVPKGDKILRAHAVSPLVEAGKVLLQRNAPWLDTFLDETCRFPKSAFADQTDSNDPGTALLHRQKPLPPLRAKALELGAGRL